MSTPQRPEPVAVIDRLLEEPYRFGFFQAVRLLERWITREEGLSSTQVLSRRLAFRNSLSLAFPPSEIAALTVLPRVPEADEPAAAEGQPDSRRIERVEITPAFLGLLGAGGALPTYYTELVAERELFHRDRAPRAFYDIFLHRAAVLFYQAWRKHRLAVQFEADRRNRYLPLMLAVAGLGQPGLRDRLHARQGGVSDDAAAFFAGTLQRRPVSAIAIQRLVQQYFGVPAKLESFIGRWFALPSANQSHLGLQNMQLGAGAVVGERVWQRDLRMRLTLGPLKREKFQHFLPGGPAALALKELLALLTGATLEYEIRLSLRAQDVSGSTLDPAAPRLGWDSFLVTEPVQEDRCDAGYDLLALA